MLVGSEVDAATMMAMRLFVPCLALFACAAESGVEFGSSQSPGAPDGGESADAGPPPSCTDGRRDATETDVDCGGQCAACAPGKACARAEDCDAHVCGAGSCAAPSPTDGVKNGSETDVDCGGGAKACAVGSHCAQPTDCNPDGDCTYAGLCTDQPTCRAHHGGDTCGPDEAGAESCCTRVALPRADGSSVWIDKYKITAGRMRAFFERVSGDVKSAMQAMPSWDHEQDELLPTTSEEAAKMVGPYAFSWDFVDNKGRTAAGCAQGYTFWQNDVNADGLATQGSLRNYPKELEDEKMLNCVTPALLRALCMYEGGDLAFAADLQRAVQADDGRPYPWGAAPPPPTWKYGVYPARDQCDDPNLRFNDPDSKTKCLAVDDALRGQLEPGHDYLANKFTYGGPGDYLDPDLSWHVPPPGRFPLGTGPYGHADLAGGLLEWSRAPGGDASLMFWNGSQENHPVAGVDGAQFLVGPDASTPWSRRYWALGGRCMHAAP